MPDLIHCTNEMNVNIPQLADTLFERTANSSWVVVFKALITTHHLMMYGNEVGATHGTHGSPPITALFLLFCDPGFIHIDLHIYISINLHMDFRWHVHTGCELLHNVHSAETFIIICRDKKMVDFQTPENGLIKVHGSRARVVNCDF